MSREPKNQKISLLGAGLAGSLLAKMLADKGFLVEVFEKRKDPRKSDHSEGRSINLALSHRGIHALQYANVLDSISQQLIPMKGRMMHDKSGKLTIQPYGEEGQHINSVSRNDLNCGLITASEESGVRFHFDCKCSGISSDGSSFEVKDRNGNKTDVKTDVIIGTDGAFSAARRHVMIQDRFDYSQSYIEHGYKEFTMAPFKSNFAMEPNYLHIWPRRNYMMIALPNPDKSFTCTLFFPFEGERSFDSIKNDDDIKNLFKEDFPDMEATMPDYISQFTSNPTSSLVTVRCFPWNKNKVLLLGDAAHAIVPFYGQGMNAAFEDCRLLMEEGEKFDFEWERLFSEYCKKRKPDADAIADLALKNFIEMRDDVADKEFLERKKADGEMHQRFGDDWIPMYTQVSFTDIPYSEAKRVGYIQQEALIRAQKQERLHDLEHVMATFNQLNQEK